MAYTDINNPPFPPAGKIAVWSGAEWVLENEPTPIPPMPTTPGDWHYENGKWIDKTPPPAPAPTPDDLTANTINQAVGGLRSVAYLTTQEMSVHITQESRAEVEEYIHDVANILATAQQKYGTGEAYAPTFPPAPTALPGKPKADGLPTPYIQFVVVK